MALYYCGGYGGLHIIPGNTGRHWYSCSRCRWSAGKDTDEHKAKVLAEIERRNVAAAARRSPTQLNSPS